MSEKAVNYIYTIQLVVVMPFDTDSCDVKNLDAFLVLVLVFNMGNICRFPFHDYHDLNPVTLLSEKKDSVPVRDSPNVTSSL